jgi:UDP-N-acetylmuramate: L-alanyl-gamma-D-glutamyl-meso-diaminopimelate ligase
MRIHFIAIGGSAMHNIAIAMKLKGHHVTGSDDEINEPSKGRLAKHGLLPEQMGWRPEVISQDIEEVILGMHAREDNPELVRACELGLRIFSYPEYLYEQSKDKTRIVIGGSHGKTSITAMILHVMKYCNVETDYMVGAQLEGFETMVKITSEAKYIVLEGDEYLASPIDRRPKFHLYHPNIALLSGIAWDHINVFPTFEIYVEQFRKFIDLIEPRTQGEHGGNSIEQPRSHGEHGGESQGQSRRQGESGVLVYCEEDSVLKSIAPEHGNAIDRKPYGVPPHVIRNGVTYLIRDGKEIPLLIFGEHNLMNLTGARYVCNAIGISDDEFDAAIQSFKGAARRLELVLKKDSFNCYKDFAHSPSKLKATTAAVKQQFPDRHVVACMELHTFSSLTAEFLKEYNGAMNTADEAYVYFNPHTIAHKKLPPISEEQVRGAFNRADLKVSTLMNELKAKNWNNSVLLFMTSGNFDGVDFSMVASELNTGK